MKPTRSARPAAPSPASATQEVRLIGGQWKRTPLAVPLLAGLRPTPSRVRETLFNWLGQDMNGWRVLDAFAGSGALGFEAASRGAASVCLVEREAVLVKSLRATQAKLGASQVQVVQADALSWMGRLSTSAPAFDLVLLDPPFDVDLFEAALRAALPCVPEGGWIYLEASRAFTDHPLPGLRLHRQGSAGAVHYHLFQRVEGPSSLSSPAAGD